MRLDPKGHFYLRRALEDDIHDSPPGLAPFSVLDFGLPILRTAEAIAVGIAFAKAMGCDPEKTLLAFAFRWTKLRGRVLGSGRKRGYISPGRRAYQDDLTVFINVPLETPLSAIGEFVNQAVQQLFQLFNGFTLNKDVVEDFTRPLLERKL